MTEGQDAPSTPGRFIFGSVFSRVL